MVFFLDKIFWVGEILVIFGIYGNKLLYKLNLNIIILENIVVNFES